MPSQDSLALDPVLGPKGQTLHLQLPVSFFLTPTCAILRCNPTACFSLESTFGSQTIVQLE